MLRAFNHMNDLLPGAVWTARFTTVSLYGPDISPDEVRRRIGMVFQEPNPFPKSIYANVAYGPRTVRERDRDRLD